MTSFNQLPLTRFAQNLKAGLRISADDREARPSAPPAVPIERKRELQLDGPKVEVSRRKRAPAAVAECDQLLTFAEAARIVGISLRQFRRLVDRGMVGYVRVSERSPRVQPCELRRFVAAAAVKHAERELLK